MITKPTEIEFLAIRFTNPAWDFGSPCFLLKPVLKYDTEQSHTKIIELAIEDVAMGEDLESNEEWANEGAEWNGTSIKRLKRVCRERLSGKKTWSTKDAEVLYKKVRFKIVDSETGEIDDTILEERYV